MGKPEVLIAFSETCPFCGWCFVEFKDEDMEYYYYHCEMCGKDYKRSVVDLSVREG